LESGQEAAGSEFNVINDVSLFDPNPDHVLGRSLYVMRQIDIRERQHIVVMRKLASSLDAIYLTLP
jgi:hypothetical protein